MYYRLQSKTYRELYYKLLLVYVDDVLAINHDTDDIMQKIGMRFEIKNDEYGLPKMYLGANVEKFQIPGGSTSWSLLRTSYVTSAIETVRTLLDEDRRNLKSGRRPHKGPLPPG